MGSDSLLLLHVAGLKDVEGDLPVAVVHLGTGRGVEGGKVGKEGGGGDRGGREEMNCGLFEWVGSVVCFVCICRGA